MGEGEGLPPPHSLRRGSSSGMRDKERSHSSEQRHRGGRGPELGRPPWSRTWGPRAHSSPSPLYPCLCLSLPPPPSPSPTPSSPPPPSTTSVTPAHVEVEEEGAGARGGHPPFDLTWDSFPSAHICLSLSSGGGCRRHCWGCSRHADPTGTLAGRLGGATTGLAARMVLR